MRKIHMSGLSLLFAWLALAPLPAAEDVPKPKLVVAIIVDQFRYDYLTRFRSEYHDGFDMLLTHGADFTNAFYRQVPTVTAVGHSIFMSGAMPAVSGIVGNSWFDRDEGKLVTSVCDWTVRSIGGEGSETRKARCGDSDPASPRRLLVSTLGDELRIAHPDAKVIGLSLKARAAILPSGHMAQAAYWFDDETGNFISSSFYMEELPAWASEFNGKKLPAMYVDRKWDGFPKWDFHAPAQSKLPFAKLPASPWGNELVEQFAESAVQGEKLGRRGVTDLLTVSFSSNDYVGHAAGPDSPEVHDMSIRTDRVLGKLFHFLDEKVGLKNVVIVLSADHGVAAIPGVNGPDRMPGGYVFAAIEDTVTSSLNHRFGKADWLIPDAGETSLYFNPETLAHLKGTSASQVYAAAKEAILAVPQLHVTRVYTRDQLDNGVTGDFIAQAETNGYFGRRSGDLMLVFEPGYLPGKSGTTHFSPYNYDRHVPVLFLGAGIQAGRYNGTVAPNDIAPTLATLLDIQTPSGSSGRVLTEMLPGR